MVEGARAQAQVRDDVELDSVVDVLTVLLTYGLREALLGRLGIDVLDQTDRGGRRRSADADLDRIVTQLVDLAFHGVGPR